MKDKYSRKDRRSYRSKMRLMAQNRQKRPIVMLRRSQRHMAATVISPEGKTIAQVQSHQEGMRCYNSTYAKKLAKILQNRLLKLKINCRELLCHGGGNRYGGVIRDFMEVLQDAEAK